MNTYPNSNIIPDSPHYNPSSRGEQEQLHNGQDVWTRKAGHPSTWRPAEARFKHFWSHFLRIFLCLSWIFFFKELANNGFLSVKMEKLIGASQTLYYLEFTALLLFRAGFLVLQCLYKKWYIHLILKLSSDVLLFLDV